MAEYKNYIQDFPNRVSTLLTTYYDKAEKDGLELTLLISLATSGFVIPYERLKGTKHISDDVSRFKEAQKSFKELSKTKFTKSELYPSNEVDKWQYIAEVTLDNPKEWKRAIENWDKNLEDFPNKKKTKNVLWQLRNALAHGNIFTKDDPITKIFFLSQKEKCSPEHVLFATTPCGFKFFLEYWFEFLKGLSVFEAE